MATNYSRTMQALMASTRKGVNRRLGAPAVSSAPAFSGGTTPAYGATSTGGPDPVIQALNAISASTPPPPEKPWGSGLPIIGDLIEKVGEQDNFGDRAKAALGWMTNDYKPTAVTMRALGTTGAFTGGAINELVNPEGTPGDDPLQAAGRNVQNLWSFDPANSEPVLYNQDWIKALRERRTGQDFDTEASGGAKAAAGITGFALDVLTDPLSFIGAGSLNRAGTAAARATSATARTAGLDNVAERAAQYANRLKASREAYGPALRHRQRIQTAKRSVGEPIENYRQRAIYKPVLPETPAAARLMDEAVENVTTAKSVAETGSIRPGQDIPPANKATTTDAPTTAVESARRESVLGDAEPGRLSVQQQELFSADDLTSAFETVAPRRSTAVSNAATPRKMKADAPEIMTPFRSMSRGVGDFAQPSLLDEIPPANNPIEWATSVAPETMPEFKLYGKKPYSFETLVKIATGDYNFGTSATRGSKATRLTAAEVDNAQDEAIRIIGQAHQEATHAARTGETPAYVGRAGVASERPAGGSTAAQAGAPGGASRARGTGVTWEPITKLGNDWERISARDWKNLHSRLKTLNKNGRISDDELAKLVRARRENDPGLWERTIDEIMYEGYPSPIDPSVRKDADDLVEAALPAARENVDKNSPTNRLLNDPTNEFEDGRLIRTAIDKTLRAEFIDKPPKHTVPTRTAAKLTAEGTDPTITGRYHEGFGRFSQYTLQKNIFEELKPSLRKIWRDDAGKKVPFAEQGPARYDFLMPRLKAAFDYLEAEGIVVNSSTGIRGIPLNLHDVLSTVNKGEAIQMFFHPNKAIPTSNLLEAADLIVKNTDVKVEDISRILTQKPSYRGGGTNNFSFVGDSDRAREVAHRRLVVYRNQNKDKSIQWGDMVRREAELYATALLNRREALLEIVRQRSARYSAEVIAETDAITRETVDQALRNIQNGTFAQRVNTVEHLDDMTKLEGGRIGAKTESIDRAIDVVDDTVAANVPADELAHLNGQATLLKAVEEGADSKQFNRTAQKVSDDAAARAQEKAKVGALNDHDASADITLMARTEDAYGKYKHSIRKNAGMEDIGDAIHTMNAVSRPMRAQYHNMLNRITKKWSAKVAPEAGDNRSLFDAAFEEIRMGRSIENITHPQIKAAAADVAELVDFFFPLREGEDLTNRFIMRFDNYNVINAAFESKGYGHIKFDLRAAEKAAGSRTDRAAIKRELSNQWRDWTITDPAEFLSVAEDVLNKMATNDAIIRDGLYRLKELRAVSSKPKPGFVKMPPPPDPKYEIRFVDYMQGEIYIDQRILPQFRQMEWFLNQSLSPKGEFGRWIQRTILPIVNMWKTGMTIWNARHWMRNGVGDTSLNYLAGVQSPWAYYRALKMMHAKSTYNAMWDGAEALRLAGTQLRGRPTTISRTTGHEIVVTSRNGIDFTVDDVYNYARDNGIFVSFPVRYDLLDDMVDPSHMQKFTGKFELTGGRAKEMVSKAHEWRDHFIRGAHMMDVLRKGKWRTKEEALQSAGEIVRHWHPDGSDLQLVESKYWRVFMPFYSWTRRALPLLVEAMVSNPQRVYNYPRAYYNAAEAMGIDLHSISSPFPVDQMFPEYMTDRITGPLFQNEDNEYMGVHPGVIQDDLSQFANDPFGEALAMLSPALKIPAEALTGARFGGAPIRDMSDYIDSNIPFINTIANVSGISPTGTLYNAVTLNANNTQDHNSILDRQANIERGLKEHGDMTALTNWLTGLQMQNMSAPNAINRAEFEARDRADQQARRERMFG